MVGHVERFNPAVEAIKEAIRHEDILSIAITRRPVPSADVECRNGFDLAVHDIDLIRWFTDSEIVEIQPQVRAAVAQREDIGLLQFRTAGSTRPHQHQLAHPVQGEGRPSPRATSTSWPISSTRQVTECFGFQPDGSYSMRHLSVGHAEPLRAELQAFVTAILTGKPPAVTGVEKLKIFPDEIAARDRIARRYAEGLADLGNAPKVPSGLMSVWAQYTIRFPAGRRDKLAAALKAEGIPTAIYYPIRCIGSRPTCITRWARAGWR